MLCKHLRSQCSDKVENVGHQPQGGRLASNATAGQRDCTGPKRTAQWEVFPEVGRRSFWFSRVQGIDPVWKRKVVYPLRVISIQAKTAKGPRHF